MSGEWNDNSPLQFEESINILRSRKVVFNTLVAFEQLHRWMPLVRRVDVEHSPGDELPTRVVYPAIGPPTRERILAIEHPSRLVYSASDQTLHGMYTNHRSIVTCEETSPEHTRVRWQTYAERGNVPVIRTVGPVVVRWFVRRSLRNLKRLLEQPISTSE